MNGPALDRNPSLDRMDENRWICGSVSLVLDRYNHRWSYRTMHERYDQEWERYAPGGTTWLFDFLVK